MELNGFLNQTPKPINKEEVFNLKAQKTGIDVNFYKETYAKLLNKKENLSSLDHKDGLYIKGSESKVYRNNICRFQQRFLREVI